LRNSGQGLDTCSSFCRILKRLSGDARGGAPLKRHAIKLPIETVEERMNRTGAMTYILLRLSHA